MLERNTVFVLGAGASYPYNFPLGSDLTAEIIDMAPQLLGRVGVVEADVHRFVKELRYSGRGSIDAFLESRTEFDGLGRLAIAARLCQAEEPYLPSNPRLVGNWYRRLWDEMCAGCGAIPSQATLRVSFVTFNYDRSLEHFLFTAFKSAFPNVTDEAAFAYLGQIQIVHLYGALGGFHYQPNDGCRPYAPASGLDDLKSASKGIHLIPQGRADSSSFKQAWELFTQAEVICFLGFGFDKTNVARLKVDRAMEWRREKEIPNPRIVLSTLGKTSEQVTQILEQMLGSYNRAFVKTYDADNLDTLRGAALVR